MRLLLVAACEVGFRSLNLIPNMHILTVSNANLSHF